MKSERQVILRFFIYGQRIVKALNAKDAEKAELQEKLSNYEFLTQFTPEECRYLKSNQEKLVKENSELREKLKGLRECLEELKSYFLGQRKMPYFMSEYEQRLIKGKVSSIDYALKQFEDVSIEDPAITGHAGPCNDSCSRHDVKPKEDGE